MTGAERQRKYREGLKDDMLFEHLGQLNAVALREKLFDALTQLEKFRTGRAKLDKLEDIRDDLVEGALYAAEKSWQEVGRRYGFKNAKKTSRVTE